MRVIEITEITEALAEYANSQETIILTRNGQAIAALMPLEKANDEIDKLPTNVKDAIERFYLLANAASASGTKAELETTFYRLSEQWRMETKGVSSTDRMSMHPAYQQIIGMGSDVIPLLLRELEKNPDAGFGL